MIIIAFIFLVALILHLMVQIPYVLLLLLPLDNQADWGLAVAMLVQGIYPWYVSPITLGSSAFLVATVRLFWKDPTAFVAAVISLLMGVIGVVSAIWMDLGIAWIISVFCSVVSIGCMLIIASFLFRKP